MRWSFDCLNLEILRQRLTGEDRAMCRQRQRHFIGENADSLAKLRIFYNPAGPAFGLLKQNPLLFPKLALLFRLDFSSKQRGDCFNCTWAHHRKSLAGEAYSVAVEAWAAGEHVAWFAVAGAGTCLGFRGCGRDDGSNQRDAYRRRNPEAANQLSPCHVRSGRGPRHRFFQ